MPSSKSAKTEEEDTMVAPTMDALSWLRKQLDDAEPDLQRSMVKTFAESLMNCKVGRQGRKRQSSDTDGGKQR